MNTNTLLGVNVWPNGIQFGNLVLSFCEFFMAMKVAELEEDEEDHCDVEVAGVSGSIWGQRIRLLEEYLLLIHVEQGISNYPAEA